MRLIDVGLAADLRCNLFKSPLVDALYLPVPCFEIGVEDRQFAFAFFSSARQDSVNDASRALRLCRLTLGRDMKRTDHHPRGLGRQPLFEVANVEPHSSARKPPLTDRSRPPRPFSHTHRAQR